MRKHWLAVIGNNDLTVARVAVGNKKEMTVTFLSKYRNTGTENTADGEVLSRETAEIKRWLDRHHIPLKKLKLAISSNELITRVITLPRMSNHDLEKILTNHIDQYFTFNVRNYSIDYRILKNYKENERAMMNILLAAFPKDRMQFIWSLCRSLGFEPSVVDLNADCLARLYSNLVASGQGYPTLGNAEAGSSPGDLAIVSLDEDKIEFVLLEKGIFFLYSDLEFNTRALLAHHPKQEEPVSPDPDQLEKEERISAPGDEEVRLYLSSYMDDQIELISAQDIPDNPLLSSADIQQQGPDQETLLGKYFPAKPNVRDTEENPCLNDSAPIESVKENRPELQEITPTSEEETLDLDVDFDDSILFELNTSLPQLDFSLAVPEKVQAKVEKREFTLEEGLPEQGEATDKEEFKQAALGRNQKNQGFSDFMLEDLFVPFDELGENLAITVTQQDQLAQDPKEELENNLEPVLSTLSELLSFFAASHFGHTVHSVYLTGDYCTLPFLAEIFQDNLAIQTKVGFPNDWQPRFEGSGKASADEWQKYGSLYGLALRED